MVFLMDTKCISSFSSLYPKLKIESEFRGLLKQLSLFYYLFIEIKSKFRALLELLSSCYTLLRDSSFD